MLEVKWEYFENSIGTYKAVAVLKLAKLDNPTILYVYEDAGSHYSSICSSFSFIKPTTVSYSLEEQYVNANYSKETLDSLCPKEILGLRLKEGCKLIEEDFRNQVKKIIDILS